MYKNKQTIKYTINNYIVHVKFSFRTTNQSEKKQIYWVTKLPVVVITIYKLYKAMSLRWTLNTPIPSNVYMYFEFIKKIPGHAQL